MKELKVIRDLLSRMNEQILYCHWKSNQHISDALIGIDDLDILIDRSQYGELQSILNSLQFKRFFTPSIRTYVGVEDYLGFDQDTGKIIHLHLHHQLVLGEKHLKGYHIPIEKEILESRRWDSDAKLYCSSYYHELLLLILRVGLKIRKRDLLKRRIVGKSTLEEFNWLIERCPGFMSEIREDSLLTSNLQQKIGIVFERGISFSRCYALKFRLFRDYPFYAQGSLLHNTVMRQYREIIRAITEIQKRILKTNYPFLRRRPSTGGITIAFVGMDGSGKSTTIQEIQSWLVKVMDVRYFYLGSGDGPVSLLRAPMKLALRLAYNTGKVSRTGQNESEKRNSSKPGIAKRLWVYALSKERMSRLVRMSRCRQRGYVVLTDRFPQSEYPGLCDGSRLESNNGYAAKVEQKMLMYAKACSPDLVIKMLPSPEIAIKRKPGELTLEIGQLLNERIRKLNYSSRTTSVIIDADQPQEKVWLDVKSVIWKVL